MRAGGSGIAAGLIWVGLAAACGQGAEETAVFPSAPMLMAADRAFARNSAERGAHAWAGVWARAGRMEGGGGDAAVGPVAVGAAIAPTLERYGARFRWEPVTAGMLWPDSLGYTVGQWWIEPDAAGAAPDTGRYMTVWTREEGRWRVALDVSLPDAKGMDGAAEFGFWTGDWTVDQHIRAGVGNAFEAYPARDRIGAVADGVVAESFAGPARFFWQDMRRPRPVRGASVRVRDPESGRWRVWWIDTVGGSFGEPFEGTFDGDVGTFVAAGDSARTPRRIRFTRRADGTVGWELAIRATSGGGWTPLWTMEFRPAEP